MPATPLRRPLGAAAAAAAGLVLLTSTGVTLAAFFEEHPLPDTSISSGNLQLEAGSTSGIELHSRFPADRRSFSGAGTCRAPSGFAACRSLSAAELAHQPLLPGDELVIAESFTASATGDNLVAEVTVDDADVSDTLPPGTTVDSTFTRDGQPVDSPAEVRGTDPQEVRDAEWQVRTVITTPRQWPVAFERKSLLLSEVTISVEQTAPGG